MNRFEGEFMSGQTEQESEVQIIAVGTLGPDSLGSIGPVSEREAGFAMDLGNPEYHSAVSGESHCMDDRLEVLGIQLAGNRAVTELMSALLNPDVEAAPLSRKLPRKIAELMTMDRMPCFHPGCAALAALCSGQPIEYIADEKNQPLLMHLANDRLRLIGIDSLKQSDYEEVFGAAAKNAAHKEQFDINPEQAMRLAKEAGAEVDPIEGEHQAVAARWDTSENTYDNAQFRADHTGDEGQAMGALAVDLGAYKKQLGDDGFDAEIVAKEMMRATLIQLAVLKSILKEGAPDIIVG